MPHGEQQSSPPLERTDTAVRSPAAQQQQHDASALRGGASARKAKRRVTPAPRSPPVTRSMGAAAAEPEQQQQQEEDALSGSEQQQAQATQEEPASQQQAPADGVKEVLEQVLDDAWTQVARRAASGVHGVLQAVMQRVMHHVSVTTAVAAVHKAQQELQAAKDAVGDSAMLEQIVESETATYGRLCTQVNESVSRLAENLANARDAESAQLKAAKEKREEARRAAAEEYEASVAAAAEQCAAQDKRLREESEVELQEARAALQVSAERLKVLCPTMKLEEPEAEPTSAEERVTQEQRKSRRKKLYSVATKGSAQPPVARQRVLVRDDGWTLVVSARERRQGAATKEWEAQETVRWMLNSRLKEKRKEYAAVVAPITNGRNVFLELSDSAALQRDLRAVGLQRDLLRRTRDGQLGKMGLSLAKADFAALTALQQRGHTLQRGQKVRVKVQLTAQGVRAMNICTKQRLGGADPQ